MELSGSNIKKFLMFSQKKAFSIFRQAETPKNSFDFRKWNFLIFQEMETLKNFLTLNNKKTHSEIVSYISRNGTF